MGALKIITHQELNSFDKLLTNGWDSKSDLTKFEFLIGLIALYRLLHRLVPITQKFQGRAIDVVAAYQEVQSSINDLEYIRQTVDEEFDIIYKQAGRLATKLVVFPEIPRTAS